MTDDITLRGTEWTVSASEKVSTGEYENYNPHITLSGEIDAVDSELDEATRASVKEQLLQLHGDLQDVLGRAAGNRIAEPDFEDWSFSSEDSASEVNLGP